MTADPVPAGAAAAPGRIERAFGSRSFAWLWAAQVISATGDWIGFFAITALAATIAEGSPGAAVSFVMAARVAPGFFLAPVMGVLVDRFDRRKVMIVSDVARAVVFALLPFVDTVWGLVVASLLLEVFTMLWSPAKEALVPSLLPTHRLTTANSLSMAAAYGTIPLAGAVSFGLAKANQALAEVPWLEPLQLQRDIGEAQALAFYFNALTFVVVAVIVWRLHLAREATAGGRRERGERVGFGLGRAVEEVKEGWQFIAVNPIVRAVHIGMATGLIGGAMLIPLGPIFAQQVIGDTDAYALFITALGLGVAVGVLLISGLQQRIPRPPAFVASVFLGGVAMVLAALSSVLWVAFTFVIVIGVAAGGLYVLGFTLLHESTDDELRGRIFSTLLTLVRLCVLLALALGPILQGLFDSLAGWAFDDVGPQARGGFDVVGVTVWGAGVRAALLVAGVIILLAGLGAARSMRIGVREGILSAMRERRVGVGEAIATVNEARHPEAEVPRGEGGEQR